MLWRLSILVLLIGGMAACHTTNNTSFNNKSIILQEAAPLKAGAEIYIYWRKTLSENPFLVKGEFEEVGPVIASKAPFGGGGISSLQLVDFILGQLPRDSIRQVNIRALQTNKLPEDQSLSAIQLGIDEADEEEFFNNYVARNGYKRLVMYLDVFLKK